MVVVRWLLFRFFFMNNIILYLFGLFINLKSNERADSFPEGLIQDNLPYSSRNSNSPSIPPVEAV
jgi:hypothetical protein